MCLAYSSDRVSAADTPPEVAEFFSGAISCRPPRSSRQRQRQRQKKAKIIANRAFRRKKPTYSGRSCWYCNLSMSAAVAWSELAHELLCDVFKRLLEEDETALCCVALVCRRWSAATADDVAVWRALVVRRGWRKVPPATSWLAAFRLARRSRFGVLVMAGDPWDFGRDECGCAMPSWKEHIEDVVRQLSVSAPRDVVWLDRLDFHCLDVWPVSDRFDCVLLIGCDTDLGYAKERVSCRLLRPGAGIVFAGQCADSSVDLPELKLRYRRVWQDRFLHDSLLPKHLLKACASVADVDSPRQLERVTRWGAGGWSHTPQDQARLLARRATKWLVAEIDGHLYISLSPPALSTCTACAISSRYTARCRVELARLYVACMHHASAIGRK